MAIQSSEAGPISGISSMATRHVLIELAGVYERQSGQRVAIESTGGVDAERRVQSGEAFDFVVLAYDAIDRLAGAGHVDRSSRVDLARSAIAVAVRAGTPRPNVGDESALREAVLNARRVAYSTGPSGVHLARVFGRWGIADAIAARLVQAPPGVPVGTLIARGDVDLGFQQLSELIHVSSIDVVGPLPPEIQLVTVFSAGVCASSERRRAAQDLLAFLASPETDGVKRRYGMEPSRNTG